MAQKERIDVLMCKLGLTESRQKAQQLIMAGEVFVNGQRVDKAGTAVAEDANIEIKGDVCPFVSRGGYKLAKAIPTFGIDLTDCICMDVGASTGGFTDCMLQNGAKKVYCIDVGYGQLAWKLRCDERVVNYERTNIRNLTTEQVPDKIDFISIDVSFISLKIVLPVLKQFMNENTKIVALIKPQFEAGKGQVGKNGVVSEKEIHISVINGILDFCKEQEFVISGLDFSPVKGPKGNIEFLLYLGAGENEVNTSSTVDNAHILLNGVD